MWQALGSCLALCILLTSAPKIRAQDVADRPVPLVPVRPETRQDLARREALKLYGLGLLRQHEDRLVDATHIFEEALQLDPEAAPVYKVLIHLYLALNRNDDALSACRKTLDVDPGDYETWSLYARQLKSQGHPNEARQALVRALACPGIAEHADLRTQLHYDLGVLCEEAQAYDQAINAFHEVVKFLDNPQAPFELPVFSRAELNDHAANTYERMINLCIQARQYDRALSFFAEGQKKHPGLTRRLNYNLAKVYLAQGQQEKALSQLDEYLKTQPHGTEAYELRIAILKKLGRGDDEILASLKQYSDRDSQNVALSLLLARQLAEARRAKDAEDIYLKLAEQAPTPEVYRGLFTAYQQEGQMERVLNLLDEALRKSAKNGKQEGDPQAAAQARAMLAMLRENAALAKALVPQAQLVLVQKRDQLQPQTRFFLGVLAARTGQLEQAEKFYRRCLENLVPPLQEHAVYGGLMEVLRREHKYTELVEVCQQGIRQTKATGHLLFHDSLSRALLYVGEPDEAIAEADKAVEMGGEEFGLQTRLNRVRVLSYAERYPQALAQGLALLKEFHQPGEVEEIRFTLSNVYSAMRDFPKAEEQLQLILQDDPNNATANNDLGYIWADQGKNLEEAERLIRKAIDLDREQKKSKAVTGVDDDKDNAAFVDSLGWVLFRRGRVKAAQSWLQKAVALFQGEEDPVVWDHLGDVYFRLQESERARDAWQKSLKLYETEKLRKADDHYKELQHKLQLLKSSP